jgi:hypothetical protein
MENPNPFRFVSRLKDIHFYEMDPFPFLKHESVRYRGVTWDYGT